MSRIKGVEPCQKNGGPGNNNGESHRLCTGYVYAIHTGHEYPRVNEADSRYTFHYTATCATCVIARLYCGMASLPQKHTSGSDGLDGERIYKFNFEIKLRSVEEKEASSGDFPRSVTC